MQAQSNAIPQPVETGRGLSILWQGRHLYSQYDPRLGADRIANQAEKSSNTLYLIPSPLFCYGVAELLSGLKENSIVLCLELIEALLPFSQEGFQLLLQQSELASKRQQEGRLFFSTATPNLFDQINDWVQINRIRRVIPLNLSGGAFFAQSHYDQIVTTITEQISLFWKNKSTKNKLSMLWYRNLFRNLFFLSDPSAAPPLSSWKELNPQHKAFFVLGAGESLEEAIPHLKANRQQFYLLAVDTALPALIEADLPPDAVVAMEAQNSNLKDILITQSVREKILLLADLVCDPCLMHYFPKKILFSSHFDTNSLLSRLYQKLPEILTVPPLGSVGVTSLYFAHLFSSLWNLEEKPLLFQNKQTKVLSAGLDFCYQRGKSHANGSYYHQKKLATNTRIHSIETPFSALDQEKPVDADFPLQASNQFRSLSKFTTLPMKEYRKNAVAMESFFQDSPHADEKKHFFETEKTLWPDRIKSFLRKEKLFLEKGYEEPSFLTAALERGGELDYLRESYLSGTVEHSKESPFLKINLARLLQIIQEG